MLIITNSDDTLKANNHVRNHYILTVKFITTQVLAFKYSLKITIPNQYNLTLTLSGL